MYKYLKGQHFLLFLLLIFLYICQVPLSKNSCNVLRKRPPRNKRIRRHHFVPYLSVIVLAKFHGKPSILHTLLIHLKRRDSLENECEVSPSKDL